LRSFSVFLFQQTKQKQTKQKQTSKQKNKQTNKQTNIKVTIDQLVKNKQHDNVVSILLAEKEIASKKYFEKLIRDSENPNKGLIMFVFVCLFMFVY